jgi:hypothetical protein
MVIDRKAVDTVTDHKADMAIAHKEAAGTVTVKADMVIGHKAVDTATGHKAAGTAIAHKAADTVTVNRADMIRMPNIVSKNN